MTDITLFGRTFPRKYLGWGLAALILVLLFLSSLGPAVGNIYGFARAPLFAAGGTEGDVVFAEAPAFESFPAATAQAPGLALGGGGDLSVQSQQPIERLIIKTGSISLSVEDTRAAQSTIEAIVAEMQGEGAFVVSASEYGGTEEQSPYVNMSIRVPAARFTETMDRIASLAVTVYDRSETADDVTDEHVDLEARLEALTTSRDRLLALMENSGTVEELLFAEQQLTQREAEIEAIQGSLNYLEQSAALSLISISLQPDIVSQPIDSTWRPSETFRIAVDRLVNSLRNFADFLIIFGVSTLPWLLALALIVYLVVRISRARRARAATAAPAKSSRTSKK